MPVYGQPVSDPQLLERLNQSAGVPAQDPSRNLTGSDYLESVRKTDPTTAAAMEAMHEGRMAGTGRNLQTVMEQTARAFPGEFNAADYQTQLQARKSFSPKGEDWNRLVNYGMTIGHGTRLMNSIGDLGNKETAPGLTNSVGQFVKSNISPMLGDSSFQDKLATFRADRDAFGSELATALRKSGMSEADIERQISGLQDTDSPVTLRARVKENLHLLGSKMGGTLAGWNTAFPNQQLGLDDMLNKVAGQEGVDKDVAKNYRTMLNMDSSTGAQMGQAAQQPAQQAAPNSSPSMGYTDGQTATNPKTGQRVIRRNGQWVPLQ